LEQKEDENKNESVFMQNKRHSGIIPLKELEIPSIPDIESRS
jgi:hypothetical protein